MGAPIERFAAQIGRRLAGNTQLEQHLAIERTFAHKMSAIVRQLDRIVWTHMDAMRPNVLTLAPRTQKIAIAVEDDDWVLTAREAIDIVLSIDADRRHFLE